MRFWLGGLAGALWLTAAGAQQSASPTEGLQLRNEPAASPNRDFLNRGVWPGYWNFGKHAYTPQTTSVRSTEIYDRLGTHMLRGYEIVNWRETRSDSVGGQESLVDRDTFFSKFFNSVLIGSDTYKGWNFALTAGDAIRTSLSPLTLRDPRWKGLRIDGGTHNQGFTALLTRGHAQRFSAFENRSDISPVLGYGAHYYLRPIDVMEWGLTFYNQHQVDVSSQDGSFFSGTQPYQMRGPKQISVWVQSDDPATTAGVSGIELEIDVVDADGAKTKRTIVSGPPARRGTTLADGVYQVTGSDVVEYLFDLPAGTTVTGATFAADVTGDYRISVRQLHDFVNLSGDLVERSWPAPYRPGATGHQQREGYPYDFKPAETEPHFTVARAEGSPALGRMRRVRFDYGIPSGKTLLGTDLKITANELILEGEIVYNSEESHFPFSDDDLGRRGERLSTGAWAWFLNARRPLALGRFDAEAGGEIFRMDPDYSGGYDSRRGGTVYFTDRGLSGEEAFTQEFPLMADNDDNDNYTDDDFTDQGRFQVFLPSRNYSGGPTGGVFPGLDEDGDLSPDNDRDRNGVPDWTEPFMLFDSDPASYVYGIDFNNNGQPDFRENDDHPDYPIRKDQKGYHAFLTFDDLLPGVHRSSIGYYGMQEIAGAGEATSLYVRAESRWQPYRGLAIEWNDDLKRVEDDVRDDVYVWETGSLDPLANVNSVLNPPPPDPLLMRKSLVNTGWLELTYQPTPDLFLSSGALHFWNRQGEIDGLQESDTFGELSLITRAAYEVRWNQFTVWGGLKHTLQEGRRGAGLAKQSTRFFAPIVKTTYRVMEGIDVQWGMSGLPGLPMSLTDNEDSTRDYDERKMVLMLIGRSDSFEGANVSISTGFELHRKDWEDAGRDLDFDTYGIFVDLVVGN